MFVDSLQESILSSYQMDPGDQPQVLIIVTKSLKVFGLIAVLFLVCLCLGMGMYAFMQMCVPVCEHACQSQRTLSLIVDYPL